MIKKINNNQRLVVGGLLIAALVGASLGILFAPHKGKRTRKTIADSVKKTASGFNQRLKNEGSNLKDKLSGM